MRVSLRSPGESSHPPASIGPPPLLYSIRPAPRSYSESEAGGFDLTRPVTPTAGDPLRAARCGIGRCRWAFIRRRHGPSSCFDLASSAVKDLPQPIHSSEQPDFGCEGRNAKGEPGAPLFNVPDRHRRNADYSRRGGCLEPSRLIWHGPPETDNQPADVVLGQADFGSMLANRGGEPGANTLNWCYGVTIAGPASSSAIRATAVLVWNEIPTAKRSARRSRSRPDQHGVPRRKRWPRRRRAGDALAA